VDYRRRKKGNFAVQILIFFAKFVSARRKLSALKYRNFEQNVLAICHRCFLKSIGEPILIAETVVTIKDRLKNFLWSYIYI